MNQVMRSLVTSLGLAAALAMGAGLGNAGSAHADACKTKKFETKVVQDACTSGGQAAAKDAMKKWTKAAKAKRPSLDCKTCHSKLAPGYDLKTDALKLFKELDAK